MLQLYDLCRLCAQKKRNKFDLFSAQNIEETKVLLHKITHCLSLQVTREDMLPKVICVDCQRAVEQFNAFRVKCHKAEERLNKMLSLTIPNKLAVTRIKQEYSELDFHEYPNSQMKLDSPKCNEPISYINISSVKNVKSEVDETENEAHWNSRNNSASSDLIQIISEEIVNEQSLHDIKQPQIEIISENFDGELKPVEDVGKEPSDIKTIPQLEEHDLNFQILDLNFQNEVADPKSFLEVKQPTTDSDKEAVISLPVVTAHKRTVSKRKQIMPKTIALKLRDFSSNEDEIDEKYFTLQEGEICDIDLDEMGALIKKKQDPNAVFNCDKCSRTFKFYKCLKKHKHWHDSQPEVFICDICRNENNKSFEFSTLKSLNNHIQRKHLSRNDNKFQCQLCNSFLPSQGQLNAHFKKVHDVSGATCQICGKQFKNKSRLNGHMKVHQEERPYVCDECGLSFKWSSALKVHIQWHKQEKKFLCSECGKKFTSKKNLIEHLNIHTGERPHVCQHCNASFTQGSAYSKHLYLHNEERKLHKCYKCNKCFSHAYLLRHHVMRHGNLRPFECSICHRTFKSQSNLCCHIKIHQEKKYGCEICGKKFAISKTLRDHMVRHTGIKHICPIPGCGKTYSQRFPLTKHFRKQHSSFSIIKKKSGKKAYLNNLEDKDVGSDFIRYDFMEKGRTSEEIIIN